MTNKHKKYPLLSELNDFQLGHFVWRGDHYTGFGLLQISRLARRDTPFGDIPVNVAFEKLDMTPHQAKIHANKVLGYPENFK